MFCRNCGTPVQEGMNNCPNCGTAVLQHSGSQQNSMKGNLTNNTNVYDSGRTVPNYNNSSMGIPNVAPQTVAPHMIDTRAVARTRKKNSSSALLYVVLGVAIAVLIALISVLIMKMGGSGGVSLTKADLTLNIDSYPANVTDSYYVLGGTMSTTGESASISINGSEFGKVTKEDGEKRWQKEVSLHEGNNELLIELTDEKGKKSEGRKISIRYEKKLRYKSGTKLIKFERDVYEGIIIRPNPATVGAVDKIGPYEHYTTMTCVGEEEMKSDGLWIKVIAPNGREGWVREDVIQIAY